jgi:hypothetical protein
LLFGRQGGWRIGEDDFDPHGEIGKQSPAVGSDKSGEDVGGLAVAVQELGGCDECAILATIDGGGESPGARLGEGIAAELGGDLAAQVGRVGAMASAGAALVREAHADVAGARGGFRGRDGEEEWKGESK